MDAIIIFTLFIPLAIPLVGFVVLSIKHQRDSLRREQEAYKESWRRARKGSSSYSGPFKGPPTRLY